MNVSLKGLPVGEWRDLTEQELGTLLKSAKGSSSEARGGTRKSKTKSRNHPRKPTNSVEHKVAANTRKKPVDQVSNRGNAELK